MFINYNQSVHKDIIISKQFCCEVNMVVFFLYISKQAMIVYAAGNLSLRWFTVNQVLAEII